MKLDMKNPELVCPNCGLRGTMKDFSYEESPKSGVKMIEHDIKYLAIGNEGWWANCSCGWSSIQERWHSQVDRQVKMHLGINGA
jgi:hypothetical protein